MSLAPAKSQARVIMQRMRNGQFCSGVAAQNSSFVLLAVAMLAIGLDVGVARITYGVVLPAFARDLQLSLTAAGLLGTLHLIGYRLGTLASPTLNAKARALALCRASHFVFACAMLVCGLASDVTTMAAGRFVAGLAAGFGVFSIFLIVFDATEPEKRSAAGSLVWSGIGVAIVASGLACGPILDGGAWRLSFIVPAILALAVAVLIPRTASAARAAEGRRCVAIAARRAHFRQVDLPHRGVFPFRRGLHLLLDLCRSHAEGNWPLFRGRYVVLGDVWSVLDRRRRPGRGPAVGRLRATHRAERCAGQRSDRLVAGRARRERERVRGVVRPGRTGQRRHAGDRHLPDPQQDERRGLSFLLYGRHREPGSRPAQRTCGRGLLADWFGLSAIGWFAAASYGAGMLAAAADGFFSQRQSMTAANLKESRHALPAP